MRDGKIFEELPQVTELSDSDLLITHQSTGVKTITKKQFFKPVETNLDTFKTEVQTELEELQEKLKTKYIELTIKASDWDSINKTCTKTVEEVTAGSRPHISLFIPSEMTAETYVEYVQAYTLITVCEATDKEIIFTCFDGVPEKDLYLIVEIHA